MIGQVKQFNISAGGVVLVVNAIDIGNNQVKFEIVSQAGSAPADINAIYWGDTLEEAGKVSATQFNLGGPLNMGGSPIDFDGGAVISHPGSSEGVNVLDKPAYLTAGENFVYTTLPGEVSWDSIDNLGIRATSTGFDGQGSIKGTDGVPTVIDAPKASVSDVTVCEGEDLTATVKLTLSEDPDGPYPYPVTVYYDVVNGSALEAGDYDGSGSYSHTFPAGSTSFDLVFPITNDDAAEPTENFFVNITNVKIDVPGPVDLESATDYTADAQGVVTILDKDVDAPPPPPPVVEHFPPHLNNGGQEADLSYATFYFQTADTALPGVPDGDGMGAKNDDVYTVKANFTDNLAGDNSADLDDFYADLLADIIVLDPNVTPLTPVLGVAIHAGGGDPLTSEKFYLLDGNDDVDPVPTPPGDQAINNEVDKVYQYTVTGPGVGDLV